MNHTHQPPLSVVMPTRNQAGFITSAVHSVMSQGVPGLELLVQDGRSSDGTQALLADLARQHPGLSWVSEPDQGPADAVNRAVRRARGPVVGWLNSDDLYTPGAAARALAALQAHPQWVMVYGEGQHIAEHGAPLGRYPTRPPDSPWSAWRDGCFICQPTAFFRRETFLALGGLDTRLRAAFDYEFWLRLFKAHPGQVGQVPEVQALSRLHEAGITLRLREQVALEAMAVLHQHLGEAPAHWLVTHAGEALAACPFEADTAAIKQHLLVLAERAASWLPPGGVDALQREMKASPAWRLAQPAWVAAVHADGWAGPQLTLRVQQPAPPHPPVHGLRLRGHVAWPRPHRLRLRLNAWCNGHPLAARSAWWRQHFTLDIPVPDQQPGARVVLQVRADGSFMPAEAVPGALDQRQLSYRVEGIESLPTASQAVGYDP